MYYVYITGFGLFFLKDRITGFRILLLILLPYLSTYYPFLLTFLTFFLNNMIQVTLWLFYTFFGPEGIVEWEFFKFRHLSASLSYSYLNNHSKYGFCCLFAQFVSMDTKVMESVLEKKCQIWSKCVVVFCLLWEKQSYVFYPNPFRKISCIIEESGSRVRRVLKCQDRSIFFCKNLNIGLLSYGLVPCPCKSPLPWI